MTALGPTYWPAEWRKSQTLFNFLAWLKEKKGYRSELRCRDGRMADPFYITDKKWDKLYLEYMKSLRDKELLK